MPAHNKRISTFRANERLQLIMLYLHLQTIVFVSCLPVAITQMHLHTHTRNTTHIRTLQFTCDTQCRSNRIWSLQQRRVARNTKSHAPLSSNRWGPRTRLLGCGVIFECILFSLDLNVHHTKDMTQPSQQKAFPSGLFLLRRDLGGNPWRSARCLSVLWTLAQRTLPSEVCILLARMCSIYCYRTVALWICPVIRPRLQM